MKRLPLFSFLTLILVLISVKTADAQMYKFSGGPSGGTFQYYASAISTLAKKNKIKVLASSSGGSIENIRTVNTGRSSFAIAYSGHVYAGRNGTLKNDDRKYENVLALAYFYGAPAQLIVSKKSKINKVIDLIGKRVAIGNAGSGAAANAEIFLNQIGIWNDISIEYLGYRGAADAFKNGQIDAFWIFAGFPNSSVLEAALQTDINLLNLYNDGLESNLFNDYPFFSKIVVAAKTYNGQENEVSTFQDAAIWIASKKVPNEVVYKLLSIVYKDSGLKYMREVHKSAVNMSTVSGKKGIITPLHPGAVKFWRDIESKQ